jgi:hypothetical protein
MAETGGAGRDRRADDESVERWIARHLANAPRLSDRQLKEIGEILGVTLIRRSATPEPVDQR